MNEQGTNEQGTNEQGTNEQGTNEQGTNEQGTNEQGTNEQGTNEQGTNEQVLEKESSTHLESGRSGLDCLRAHANAVISENKKNQVLERLARMVEKQKKIDQETYRALLAALELKDTGDDIADHVIILIAELATIRNAGTGIGRLS